MAKAPRVTTQLLSRIRCAYVYAIEQGRLPDEFLAPTLGIKGAPQVRRKRVLTDADFLTARNQVDGRVRYMTAPKIVADLVARFQDNEEAYRRDYGETETRRSPRG